MTEGRIYTVADRFGILSEVHDRGLMIGLDFTQTTNPLTRGIRNQTAALVAVQMLHRHNIISLYTFTNASVFHLAPPLTVDQTDLDRYLDALEETLEANRRFGRLALKTMRTTRSHRNRGGVQPRAGY